MRLRLDSAALYAAVDGARRGQQLSWRAVASETGLCVSTLKRLRHGHPPDAHGLLTLLVWSGLLPEEVAVEDAEPAPERGRTPTGTGR